jgi:hypothetical protein
LFRLICLHSVAPNNKRWDRQSAGTRALLQEKTTEQTRDKREAISWDGI